MIIIADQEGRIVLEQMADVALRHGGLKNLSGVSEMLRSIQEYVPPKPIIPETPPGQPGEINDGKATNSNP